MELQIFTNEEFGEVRSLIINEEPMFCLTDVCKALGLTQPSKVKDRLIKKGVNSIPTLTSGGEQKLLYINEANLYKTIFQSRKESAERFTNWVTEEVLPTIRKTGGYVNNDDLFISTYLPYADETTKSMFKSTLSVVRKQNEIIEQQKQEIAIKSQEIIKKDKELEYKEDVIINLVDEVTLAEKRQILNRVVKYGHANMQERWGLLYREFEDKYHISLKRRLENYNKTHSPKCKNKLDYIDKVLNKVPELYELAVKLFENDVKELIKEMYYTTKKK